MTDFDDLDTQIVKILQRDGSITNLAIAEELNLSEATVRRRRTRLEQEGFIRRVGVVADPLKLGYSVVAIIGVQIPVSRILSVESEIKKLPEVHFLGLSTGKYAMMLEVWLRSNEDLVKFTTEKLSSIDETMKVDVFQFVRISKYYGWAGDLREA